MKLVETLENYSYNDTFYFTCQLYNVHIKTD